MSNLVSMKCVNFVKGFEGFSSTPYDDGTGVITLGYGMTGTEIQGISYVSEEQASQMLENLLNNTYAAPIKNDLDSRGVTLTQNEFDALVSMAYNIGTGGLLGSTLYRNVIAGVRDRDTITSNFQMWNIAGGQRLEGLYRRRTEEAEMFFGNDSVANATSASSDYNVIGLQYNLNRLFNAGLVVDGVTGPCTNGAISKYGSILGSTDAEMLLSYTNQILAFPLVQQGSTGPAVRYVQYRVGASIDGSFGPNTKSKVMAYQNSGKDGIVGPNTWAQLMQ